MLSGARVPAKQGSAQVEASRDLSFAMQQQGILPMICLALLYRFRKTA